jgi:hypothetical protein
MFDDVHEKLLAAAQAVRERDRLRSRREALQQTLDEKRSRYEQLQSIVQREQRDVDRLEGMSLAAMFHSVIGNKREKLDEEQRELLEAKLRADEAAEEIEPLEASIEEIDGRLRGMADVDAQYRAALEAKENAIEHAGGAPARELMELSEAEAEAEADLHELREAIEAGRAAEAQLAEVVRQLGSAGNWGTWDMIGGGLISTAIKHSKIDDARAAAHRAQMSIERFRAELGDVDRRFDVTIDIGGFATFADYFFDGLIVDWMVQSKIRTAKDSAEHALRSVSSTLATLSDQAEMARGGIDDARAQRRETIERAGT